MKSKEPSLSVEPSPSSNHGNISPINGSISNLVDDGKPSASKSTCKTESSSKKLSNFSQVMPNLCIFPSQPTVVTNPYMTYQQEDHLALKMARQWWYLQATSQ